MINNKNNSTLTISELDEKVEEIKNALWHTKSLYLSIDLTKQLLRLLKDKADYERYQKQAKKERKNINE
jgi:hypothetical protein